jgi:hypothetical protein
MNGIRLSVFVFGWRGFYRSARRYQIAEQGLFKLERKVRVVQRKGAEVAEGAQRKTDSKFEISNLKSEAQRFKAQASAHLPRAAAPLR